MTTKRVAFTVDEVAAMYRLHANTVRKMIADGRLQRIPNTGRTIRIAAGELEAVFGVDLDGAA